MKARGAPRVYTHVMRLLALWLPLLGIAHAQKPEAAAAGLVAKVQKYYDATRDLRARFEQQMQSPSRAPSKAAGEVWLKKPGKMRWDYTKPEKKYFISDGTTLWVYEKANKQAFKQDLKGQLLPVAVTFLYGQGNLGKDFDPSLDPGKYGAPTDLVVKLVPKQPTAQYKALWLVVDPSDFHVKQSVILEVSGNTNSFEFSAITTNEKAKYVGTKLFKFVPPAGVKVITAPAQPAQPGAPDAPAPAPADHDNGK